MKRKLLGVIITSAVMLSLTGCADVPDISKKQQDLIAEYSGGILLRYSDRYDLRLVMNDEDGDGMEDDMKSPAPSEGPDSTAQSSPSPTPGTTDEPAASAEASEIPQETERPTVGVNEIYGISGLDFSYSSYETVKTYPKNSSDVTMTADKDGALLVVNFNVKNTTKNDIKVDLTGRNINYELDVGGSKIAPSISILDNGGLNYLMTTIKPGKTEKAVLIFNLDKTSVQTAEKQLEISEGDKLAIIKL